MTFNFKWLDQTFDILKCQKLLDYMFQSLLKCKIYFFEVKIHFDNVKLLFLYCHILVKKVNCFLNVLHIGTYHKAA